MLIARLIADADGMATRLDDMTGAVGTLGISPMGEDGVELVSVNADRAGLRDAIDAHFDSSDGLIAPSPIAIPQVFVSDMDSTMIGQECIDELADYAGLKAKIAEITEKAMLGELDFREALKERVALLKGLEVDAITRCLSDRIWPTPGARTLVQTLNSKGCRTVLVTGGFHHFADAVGEAIGFDRVVGNRLNVIDGKLTGELEGAIVDSDSKRQTLEREGENVGSNATTLAIGDGANDIPMIEAATYGFAYCAKPKARAAADGWIDRGDLTSVLRLLGIPESEWVMD